MDVNTLVAMTDEDAIAFLTNPANHDPERKAPTITLQTIANTWNCIALDLANYAFTVDETQYAIIGAVRTISEATADLDWDTSVTITLGAHPVTVSMATKRGAQAIES